MIDRPLQAPLAYSGRARRQSPWSRWQWPSAMAVAKPWVPMARRLRSAGDRLDCRRGEERSRMGAIQCPERSSMLATWVEAHQRMRRIFVRLLFNVLFLSTMSCSIAQHCVAISEPGNFAGSSLMNEHVVIY